MHGFLLTLAVLTQAPAPKTQAPAPTAKAQAQAIARAQAVYSDWAKLNREARKQYAKDRNYYAEVEKRSKAAQE